MTRLHGGLTRAEAGLLVDRTFRIMETGSPVDFEAIVHPDAFNAEAKDEPPEARIRGPVGFHATKEWLNDAFADLRWEVHEVVVDGDLIAVHATMRGRHVRTFISYRHDGSVDQAFPATGRTFASTQSHWLRLAEGKIVTHWANRDDLGQAVQLGWAPPSPIYLLRSAVATRRARRAATG